jgi:hypothetical protein
MTPRFRIILPAAFVLASMIAVPTAASAQALGIHGGATYSTFKFEEPKLDTKGIWGGSGGVFLVLGGRGLFGGIVEANWARKGMKLPSGTEITVDYLEIPVAARLTFGPGDLRIFGIGGGTFAFKLSASQSGPPIFEDLDADIDGWEHGVLAGGGVEYKKLVASGRYTWGTRDLSDRPIEAYNRGWTFLVGYKLLGGN